MPPEEIALPRDDRGDPVFEAPWQAAAFAMAVALHEKGVFEWCEWAEALAWEIAAQGSKFGADAYYQAWLTALERIAAEKQAVSPAEMEQRYVAWDRAARATPHGEPIVLGRERLA